MDDRIEHGSVVRSWSGDARGWPEAALEQGPVRISGTVLGPGASWHVTTDRLGWSTITLVADLGPVHVGQALCAGDVSRALCTAAAENADPVRTALEVRELLGSQAHRVGLAIARIGPHGALVELLNVSLPTVLQWDPIEGLSPYEPVYRSLAAFGPEASTEVLRLREGGAVALTTCGVLPLDASWRELRGFVRALGLDPLGGIVADAPPIELARLLHGSWTGRPGAQAVVVVGLPPMIRQVA